MGSTSVPFRPQSVLDAFRAAAARHAVGLDDGTWVKVGTLLEHAALLPRDERGLHLALVAIIVREVVGEAAWRVGHPTDPNVPADCESLEGRLRVYCETIEDAGALEVADAILAAYVAATGDGAGLECARVESVRARIAWKRGDLDVAGERYRRVAVRARRLHSDELRVRAWTGDAIVARLRGNFPESRAKGRRAVELAERAGLQRLASIAHQSLMVAEAVAGRFAAAIDHAWKAYLCAEGDTVMESAALGNVGQLFLDAGDPTTATTAFRLVMQRRPPARILVPALGGFALAAARLRALEELEWATTEIAVRTESGAAPYDVATVMLDLARAYATIHDRTRTEALQHRARELARTHGFHEIEHHADVLMKSVLRLTSAELSLSAQTETVAHALRVLADV